MQDRVRRQSEGGNHGALPPTGTPNTAMSAGSPALAPLMLSLGRLVLTRLVLTRGRRAAAPRG